MYTQPHFISMKFNRYLCIAIVILVSLVSACSGGSGDYPFPSSTPEEQGMDSELLLKMLDFIDPSGYILHSLLIMRHGKLVLEAYYPPFGPQDKQMLFSATKSFTSALVGMVMTEGKIQSADQPIADFFPEANLNECKQNIHLHDLLNMTSGLDANDVRMGESADWSQFTIDSRCYGQPGTFFGYLTGNTQLLSAIVQKASGVSALEYAQKNLFAPLDIKDVYWAADPSGVTQGGCGLMLTPRDMLKFGTLYLHDGQWQDKQIVPAEWIEASTQKNDNGYANQWWQAEHGFFAGGLYGQYIYVMPEQDMVVVSTAGLRIGVQDLVPFLVDMMIIPAVKSDQALPESPFSEELADRLKAIANPAAQTLTDLPAMAATVSAKTIQLDDNPLGWKTAQLVFEDGQAWLTITTTAIPEERKFAIGLDGVYRKTEVKGIEASGISEPEQRYIYNPYEFNFVLGIPIDGAVAMRGEWKDDKRFILTVQDTRDVDLDILTFTFTPVDVKVEWQSHVEIKYVNLTGKLE